MRSPSSRATMTMGILSISPAPELVWRYRMSCSRVAMKAIAFAFALTARSTMGGAFAYSANRSAQVFRTVVCTRRILPVTSPAFWKSASLPSPTSITGTCFTGASAGAQATETARTRKEESTVAPPTRVGLSS